MKKFKRAVKKIFNPPTVIVAAVCAASAALLIIVFTVHGVPFFVEYPVYALAAYALCVAVIKLCRFLSPKIKRLLLSNKYTSRFLTDANLRSVLSLYSGFALNLAYAAMKLVMGISNRSVWLLSISMYYAVLTVIRLNLLTGNRKSTAMESDGERKRHDAEIYTRSGAMMLVMIIAVSIITLFMVRDDRAYHYPGVMIYAFAAFTFYNFISSFIAALKHRHSDNMIFSAAKMMGFAVSAMSVLSLQTAMLSTFDSGGGMFRRVMNGVTGAIVCAVILILSVNMIVSGKKELKKITTA